MSMHVLFGVLFLLDKQMRNRGISIPLGGVGHAMLAPDSGLYPESVRFEPYFRTLITGQACSCHVVGTHE